MIRISSFFLGALALMFTYLKLTHQIDWSWFGVMAPIWGPIATVACILVVGWSAGVLLKARDKWRTTRTNRKKYGF